MLWRLWIVLSVTWAALILQKEAGGPLTADKLALAALFPLFLGLAVKVFVPPVFRWILRGRKPRQVVRVYR